MTKKESNLKPLLLSILGVIIVVLIVLAVKSALNFEAPKTPQENFNDEIESILDDNVSGVMEFYTSEMEGYITFYHNNSGSVIQIPESTLYNEINNSAIGEGFYAFPEEYYNDSVFTPTLSFNTQINSFNLTIAEFKPQFDMLLETVLVDTEIYSYEEYADDNFIYYEYSSVFDSNTVRTSGLVFLYNGRITTLSFADLDQRYSTTQPLFETTFSSFYIEEK